MAVALAQKDMVAGPDAVTMGVFLSMSVIMSVIVAMRMAMVMPMIMGVTMHMTMQCVIVRHGGSLERYG